MTEGWMAYIDFEGEIVDAEHSDVSTYVKLPDPTTDESVWYCSLNGSTARVSEEHIELNSLNLRRMGGCSDAVAVEGSIRIQGEDAARPIGEQRRVLFRDFDEEVFGISNFAYPELGGPLRYYDPAREYDITFGTFGARTGAVVTGWPIGGDYAGYVKMPGSDIIFCVGTVGSEDGDLVLNELAQLPSCETSAEIDGELEICTGR